MTPQHEARPHIESWLTDMDGVLVHENHALPGAPELIHQWVESGTPFLVLTNNSIFTPRDLAARLRASGPPRSRRPSSARARSPAVRRS
jgi:NagD protein